MNYRNSRSLFAFGILRQALFFFLLFFPSAELIYAQPGKLKNAPEMEEYLRPAFAELARQIESEPQNTALYVRRSDLYMQIYGVASHGLERMSYVEKALADLSLAIEVNPTAEAHNARARWHNYGWSETYPGPENAKAIVDYFLRNKYFDAIQSDLLISMSLDQSDKNLTFASGELSQLYSVRAENLSKPAIMRELLAQGESYSVWADFDTAIEYAKTVAERGGERFHRENLAAVYATKDRAATELCESEFATEVFWKGDKYFNAYPFEICRYYSEWPEFYRKRLEFHKKREMFPQASEKLTKGQQARKGSRRLLLERGAVIKAIEGKPVVPSEGATSEKPNSDVVEQLKQATQELLDAIAPGKKEVWEKYLAEGSIYSDEEGNVKTKEEILKEFNPLPKGYIGSIKMGEPKVLIQDNVIALSHRDREELELYGQKIVTYFHSTNTWAKQKDGQWQIIATQTMAIPNERKPMAINPQKLDAYVGQYQLSPEVTYIVTREGDKLFGQRTGRAKDELLPLCVDIFYRKGVWRGEKVFEKDAQGNVVKMLDRRENNDLAWKKIK